MRVGLLLGGATGLGLFFPSLGRVAALLPGQQVRALALAFGVYAALGLLATLALGLLLPLLPRPSRAWAGWAPAAVPAAALACELVDASPWLSAKLLLAIFLSAIAATLAMAGITHALRLLRSAGLWAAVCSLGLLAACTWIATRPAARHGIPLRELALVAPLLLLPALLVPSPSVGRGWKRRGALALAGILSLALLFLGGRPRGDEVPGSNLLLITVDTLRRDFVSVYAGSAVRTPAFETLATDGVVFDDAISPIPLTQPSHVSLLSGLDVGSHGITLNRPMLPTGPVTTLPEILARAGFRTAAFVSTPILARSGSTLHHQFQVYGDEVRRARPVPEALTHLGAVKLLLRGVRQPVYRVGSHTVAQAIEWLRANRGSRFFLWVHLYDPHGPYHPTAIVEQGIGDAPRSGGVLQYQREPIEVLDLMRDGPTLRLFRDLYAEEVTFADANVGRLLDALREERVFDETLVALTADHGENLMQRSRLPAFFDHSEDLYEPSLRVPLVLRFPGGEHGGARVPGPVSLIDLAPTLLDGLGLPVPEGLDGVSRMDAIRGQGELSEDRTVVSVLFEGEIPGGRRMIAVRGTRYKYIWSSEYLLGMIRFPETEEFFDLASDPLESANLAGSGSEVEQAYRRLAREKIEAWTDLRRSGKRAELDEATRSKLRALGYSD